MEKYLLEETSEALEMREKIKQMFISREPENTLLAIQLIDGGGLPADLVPYLWVLPFVKGKSVKTAKVNALLKKALQPDTYTFFSNMKKDFKEDFKWEIIFEDVWVDKNLQLLMACEETAPLLKDFALAFLYVLRMGGGYILRHGILPDEQVLRAIIQDDTLSFANFKLKSLPTCIGEFSKIKRLNLSGNLLTDVPDGLANLKKLEHIYLDGDINELIMSKLDLFFPKIMSNHYHKIGSSHMDFNEIEKAINAYQKAVTLQDNLGVLWNDLAYAYSHGLRFEEAFVANNKAIDLAENVTQKASYLSGRASDEQRYGLAEKSKETSEQVLALLSTVPENQWDESDFFSCALSSQILGKYETALEFYEKYGSVGYHEYDGSLHYNKACVYAQLGNREEMVLMIRKAIQSDNIDWVAEVRHDLDFQAYWQDPILDELQKEYDEKLPF